MKKYKSCEFCECGDCKDGSYRSGSWYCLALKKQICEICCYFDMEAVGYIKIRKLCKKLKCKYYKGE